MDQHKFDFLKKEFMSLIKKIDGNSMPAWGSMNAQQMIEHLSDSVRIANGKVVHTTIVTPTENLPKMKAFIMSDIPFKENTKNRMLSEIPAPVRQLDVDAAIAELQKEMDDFFGVFEKEPNRIIVNPIFGELDQEAWIHLLYKHCTHHLKQFHLLKN